MRALVSLLILPGLFLTSCANQGVIVRKDSNALPFYHSVGVEGSYSFYLRDNAGAVHRQLVTPDIFESYAVGQYFNDQQSGTTGMDQDSKQVRPVLMAAQEPITPVLAPPKHRPTFDLTARSKKATPSVAQASSKQKAVAKRTTQKKAVVKKSSTTKPIAAKSPGTNKIAKKSSTSKPTARKSVTRTSTKKSLAKSTVKKSQTAKAASQPVKTADRPALLEPSVTTRPEPEVVVYKEEER